MAARGSLKRPLTALIAVVFVVFVVGAVGYFVFQIQTPVTLEDAVDRFRGGNDEVTAGTRTVGSPTDQKTHDSKGASRTSESPRRRLRIEGAPESAVAGARVRAPGGKVVTVSDQEAVPFGVLPAEGVYSYVGEGEESFNGLKREFPTDNTYRTVTHLANDTWKEQHIFSEERASWTKLTAGPEGRFVPYQRNLIVIGPYRRDTTVPFDPPMHAALFPPVVDQTWSGEFTGRTRPDGEDYTGTYTVRMTGDEVWRVGGEPVRVLGYELDVEFKGELNAVVNVKYWFSPFLGVTVHEDYSIDAAVLGLRYQAEWNVKLTSLQPAT